MISDSDLHNLLNRIAASRKAATYKDRTMVDTPSHILEALVQHYMRHRKEAKKP